VTFAARRPVARVGQSLESDKLPAFAPEYLSTYMIPLFIETGRSLSHRSAGNVDRLRLREGIFLV
jgi:hypothetical protein